LIVPGRVNIKRNVVCNIAAVYEIQLVRHGGIS
jgi:hypothetical protein